jgi:hypothetical protein
MDECPLCERSCTVSCGPRAEPHFICYDCQIHWPPPQNAKGGRPFSVWPIGAPLTRARIPV